jgi:predicted nuclease of predicted toxin-antitoxin system
MTAQHVGELGMARATDESILQAARERSAVVVTLDADFHSLLAAGRATAPSVVRIRIEGLKGEAVADILQQVVTAAGAELETGAAVSVSRARIAVRLLPLA